MLDMIPANRSGKVEEMANLAAYLVSPYASWISGEIVKVSNRPSWSAEAHVKESGGWVISIVSTYCTTLTLLPPVSA